MLFLFRIVSRLIQVTSKSRVRRSGISPLHLAAEHNKDNTLEVLIEADFDVNAKLSTDRSSIYQDRRTTALYFAVTNSNVDAAAMLLEAGANPNLDIFNPLLVAVKQGCVQMVCLLVEHRADINVKIPTHPTSFPASVMFCMKYLSLLKYLMDNGCDALSCFKCEHGTKPHPPMRNIYKDDLGLCHEEPGVQVGGISRKMVILWFERKYVWARVRTGNYVLGGWLGVVDMGMSIV